MLASAFVSPPLQAATVADSVRQHVAEGLERPSTPKKKPRPRHDEAKPRPARDPTPGEAAPAPETAPAPLPGGAPDTPPPPAGPAVPQRVFGENFRFDPTLGGGVRGWVLQQYPSVSVSAREYFTWSVEASAKLFKLINIHKGYYESNGLSGPRTSSAVTAASIGAQVPKAAWLLGVIGVPITKAWEPIIRYETRAFRTRAEPSRPVRVVPHDTPADTDLSTIAPTTTPLTLVSGFETLVLGVRYTQGNDSSVVIDPKAGPFPPIYFGVGFVRYTKPYQVSVGNSVLDDVLFDARFQGGGIAFGVDLPTRPDHVIFNGSAQLGLGEVRLLDDLTLNELLPNTPGREGLRPPEWLIGYLQGDVTVGYVYPLLRTKPSVIVTVAANGGGATFFYFKTQVENGETVGAPPLNWDFLWGVRASVTVPL